MNKQQSSTLRRVALALSGLLIGPLFFSAAYGSSGGRKTDGQGCSGCHDDGVVPQISITGLPTEVPVDSEHTLTLVITGGPAVIGGLNVAVDSGSGILAALDPLTTIDTGELIHTSPKDFDGDTVSWEFLWTAPSVNGTVDLRGAGVSANDGMGSGGDYAGTTVFTVQVVPIPAAAFLFASGLGFLGWARRWSAK